MNKETNEARRDFLKAAAVLPAAAMAPWAMAQGSASTTGPATGTELRSGSRSWA